MANKIINNQLKKRVIISILSLTFLFSSILKSPAKEITLTREAYLSNLNSFMLTKEFSEDKEKLEELLKTKKTKAVYIEEWLLQESKDKNFLKKLRKITNNYECKLFLVTGRNIWFGKRGVDGIISAYNNYESNIDGIVFRIEPNKSNVWKDDLDIQAQILNQMLDAFSAIYSETRKRNKIFIVEVPFWLSEFHGPNKSFTEDICSYTDKIVFLIDDKEKLDKLESKWNDVTCPYNINLGKRATRQSTEAEISELYTKVQEKLIFYSNFNGYIIDTDSTLDNKRPEISEKTDN